MFLNTPPAAEDRTRFCQTDVDTMGYVMNLTQLWAWRPDVCEAFAALRMMLTSRSSLSTREVALTVCATAAEMGDSYCALAWGNRLAGAANAATAAAVLSGEVAEGMTPREVALAAWAQHVVSNPNATTAAQVEQLRSAGFKDQEIFEATVLMGFRLAFSTVNDALGAAPDGALAAAVPPEVREAVSYGRAPTAAPAPVDATGVVRS